MSIHIPTIIKQLQICFHQRFQMLQIRKELFSPKTKNNILHHFSFQKKPTKFTN